MLDTLFSFAHQELIDNEIKILTKNSNNHKEAIDLILEDEKIETVSLTSQIQSKRKDYLIQFPENNYMLDSLFPFPSDNEIKILPLKSRNHKEILNSILVYEKIEPTFNMVFTSFSNDLFGICLYHAWKLHSIENNRQGRFCFTTNNIQNSVDTFKIDQIRCKTLKNVDESVSQSINQSYDNDLYRSFVFYNVYPGI